MNVSEKAEHEECAQSESSKKLKTCPFCKKKAFERKTDTIIKNMTVYHVTCKYCGADISAPTPEQARSAWNDRAQPENPSLSIEQLRQIDGDMDNRRWVWIVVLPEFHQPMMRIESAYYQVQSDFTHGKSFCCGYPGLMFQFDYADYGKTWIAYICKPEGEKTLATPAKVTESLD